MATVRTPAKGGAGDDAGIELALDNWHDYKQQALHNLEQMKGHIAEAGKLRSEQKATELSRETERELGAAKAWCGKIEQELHLAHVERDESRLAAESWRAQHRQAQAEVAHATREAAAVREEATSSARECAELVLEVGQLEGSLTSERAQHEAELERVEQELEEERTPSPADEQLAQAAMAVQSLGTVLAKASSSLSSSPAAAADSAVAHRKPWHSPAMDGYFHRNSVRTMGLPGRDSSDPPALVEKVVALLDERDRAEAACRTLNERYAAALAEQANTAETIHTLREASALRETAEEWEREQSVAAVAAAVGAARAEHAAVLRDRDAQWQREREAVEADRRQEALEWEQEPQALRQELAELRVQTTALRAALAAKSNESPGLGAKVRDAQAAARAAESAAREAEEEAVELREELQEARVEAERRSAAEVDVERHEKKRRAAEAECAALRAELDAALRAGEEEEEARRQAEGKLAAGRAAVTAAVTEADILRGEWEEERVAVQQTMELAEQRLKEQATALSAVASVSPAAAAAVKRVTREQEQQRMMSPERGIGGPLEEVAPPVSPVRSHAQPPVPERGADPRTPSRRRAATSAKRESTAHPPQRRRSSAVLGTPADATHRRGSSRRRGSASRHQQPQAVVPPRQRQADYAKQVEQRDEMLRQITDVAGRDFVTRNGLGVSTEALHHYVIPGEGFL